MEIIIYVREKDLKIYKSEAGQLSTLIALSANFKDGESNIPIKIIIPDKENQNK